METIVYLFNSAIRLIKEYPILGSINTLCFVAILFIPICLIFWGLFTIIDSWFAVQKEEIGRIITKQFSSGFYTIRGRYPDTFRVLIQVADHKAKVDLKKESYQRLLVDDELKVKYVRGRISGRLYIRDLNLL